MSYLREELAKLDEALEAWQQSEVVTNIFLLSCAVSDTLADHLLGDVFEFSKAKRIVPWFKPGIGALESFLRMTARMRGWSFSRSRHWIKTWGEGITQFLQHSLVSGVCERKSLLEQRDRLAWLLGEVPLSRAAGMRRVKIPAYFRSRDFAPQDCLELCRKFVDAFPEDDRPILAVGLRTAGSFLAPLACACLRQYRKAVRSIAIRPGKGVAPDEAVALRRAAEENAWVLVADESIHSGETLANTVELLRSSGFHDQDIVVLNPAEPAFPNWRDSAICQSLPKITTLTLEPSERYKSRLLESNEVEFQLKEYFRERGYIDVDIALSQKIGEPNCKWRTRAPERVDIRLKRIYQIDLERSHSQHETRYVLAKSVGWGWLSYHAFLAAERLSGHVPGLLGLRNGILYVEWIPAHNERSALMENRNFLVESAASYVAARAQELRLDGDPTPDLAGEQRHKGWAMLANSLSRAYNSRLVAALKRRRIMKELACLGRPPAVMTDSKMALEEWVVSGGSLLKTDFEHHAQGKNELGMTDPAYDLAGAVFHFGLSGDEAKHLVQSYIADTGDTSVEDRFLFHKLLVGLWEQNLAVMGLLNRDLFDQRGEFHRRYTRAWNFLVSEAIEQCGRLCQSPASIAWKSPLVVTDIDGVLDRMVFGFPCSTKAGVEAISLLNSHGFTVAVNTARSLDEVKRYCRCYGLAGGLAEYGAVIWDAVGHREIGLVSSQSLVQLKEVKDALQRLPGVFVNDDYRFSLRAFTYQGHQTVALPNGVVRDLLAEVKADHLYVHQTGLDTAILAKEADKGAGLLALLALVGLPEDATFAIGDSQPDLAMFRVAKSSFAPGHIQCQREARLLGCNIASLPYQPGLLQIARKICHPEGNTCNQCRTVHEAWEEEKNLWKGLLEAADQRPFSSLLRNFPGPAVLDLFKK